jgi:sugar lactone lactonase YvrE
VRFAIKLLAPALVGLLGLAGTTSAFGAEAASTTPAGTASAGAPPEATTPATTTPLASLTGFRQMAVDATAGYVFLSEGVGSWQLQGGSVPSSGVVVTDLAGKYVATLDGGAAGGGAEGIAVSPDGGTLYAALAAKGTVAAINVATISGSPKQALYAMPAGDVPYSVAVQGGKLWVSAESASKPGFVIGDFDLSAPGSFTPVVTMGSGWAAPDLAADPSGRGLVAGAIPGFYQTPAVTIDATTGKVLAGPAFLGPGMPECASEDQLAVVPGTGAFVTACGAEEAYRYSATDLGSPQQSYPATAGAPDAVAVSGNGDVIVGEGADAYVYEPDGTLDNVLLVGAQGPASGGLAVSGDGTRLYAVTATANPGRTGTSYALEVFGNPEIAPGTRVAPALTLRTGGPTAAYGSAITVTAHLGAWYTNRDIAIYYQPLGTAARKLLASGAVSASGDLTASLRDATRNVVFTAVFTGDGRYTAETLTTSVGVQVQRVAMTNSGYYGSSSYQGIAYRLYHHTGYLGFSVTVAPNKHGQCVRLLVQQLSSKGTWFGNGTLGCFALTGASAYASRLSLSGAAGARYRLRPAYVPSKADPTNVTTYGSWFYFQVLP